MSAADEQKQLTCERANRVLSLLREHFGAPCRPSPHDPIGGLISTILSQNTSDTNTERAFRSLIERYQNWRAVEEAPVNQLEDAIRIGGLARQKAPRIQAVLKDIRESQGDYVLDVLQDMDPAEAAKWLTKLDGVGPKTAACVQLFNLGQDVLPVDTHVHRVSRRLGLIPDSTSAEAAQQLLEAVIPASDRYDAHVLMIRHGRMICRARSPKCDQCPLRLICPSAQNYLQGAAIA